MNYLLDTNTVSGLIKANPITLKRLESESPQKIFIAQPIVSEIDFGIERLPKGKRKTGLIQRWSLFRNQLKCAEWTYEVSKQFAVIKTKLYQSGSPLEDFDIAIAAHALAFNMHLVTNNTQHMQRITGISLEDWT